MDTSRAFRIVVARDPLEPAEFFLPALRHAGIPQRADALAVSVAEASLPMSGENAPASDPGLASARASAEELARMLGEAFPTWTVRARAEMGSPAWETIRIAEEASARLIVAGATSSSALERVVFGSTSYSIAAHARTSVRIVRPVAASSSRPPLLMVCVDGSPDAQEAVNAMVARAWPAGTGCVVALVSSGSKDGADFDQARQAQRALSEHGLDVRFESETGDPKRGLLAVASREEVDCIFLGARGRSGIVRVLLGGVSSSLVARAHCSVEVVRPTI